MTLNFELFFYLEKYVVHVVNLLFVVNLNLFTKNFNVLGRTVIAAMVKVTAARVAIIILISTKITTHTD